MNNINNMAISYTSLIIALVVVGVALYFFIDHKQKLNKEMKKQEDEKLMEQAKEEVKAVSLSAAPVHLDLEVKENFTLEGDNESDNSSEEECVQVEQKNTVSSIQQNQEIEGVSSSASMPAPFVNL